MSWGMGNVGGGGAGGLNFYVVGGTNQPIGKENLIWVNTANSISAWEFSSIEPTSPVSGMVWFKTSVSGSMKFNALKRNGIWVYPNLAFQYISGAWISRQTSIYQNGIWKPLFDGRIFDNGLVNNITFSKTSDRGTFTVGSTLYANTNATWTDVWFFSDQSVDVTPYQIMRVTYKNSGYISGASIGLATTRGTSLSSYKRDYAGSSEMNTEVTRDINISSAEGQYYVGCSSSSSGNGSSAVEVKSISLII